MPPDFHRDVHCVLGLPFDAVSEAQAAEFIVSAANAKRRCFLSTPNLNFVIGCLTDPAFRAAVVNSDLSTADGMPIVWIARLLGIPVRHRAAGSAIFERLRISMTRRLGVYFFGGAEGAAEMACERLTTSSTGMQCVGFAYPGFGSVEQMSRSETLAAINSSGAEFVVVALGAKKGQAWIERNRAQLVAPVVSHLGAVMNFAAGTVTRAPTALQTLGLEWLWRIKEEPALWSRYLSDGFALMHLLLTRVFPHAFSVHMGRLNVRNRDEARFESTAGDQGSTVHLYGDWVLKALQPLRDELTRLASSGQPILLNLHGVTFADSAFVALLQLLDGWQRPSTNRCSIREVPPEIRKLLHWSCADYLLADSEPIVGAAA